MRALCESAPFLKPIRDVWLRSESPKMAHREVLPSFSSKDLSSLISTWMGTQSSGDYRKELEAFSGPDFQHRVLSKRRQSEESNTLHDSTGKASQNFRRNSPSHGSIDADSSDLCNGEGHPPEHGSAKRQRYEFHQSVSSPRNELKICIEFVSRVASLSRKNSSWPTFSGTPSEFERIKASMSTFSFNSLEHSEDDLTVLVGEIFLQVNNKLSKKNPSYFIILTPLYVSAGFGWGN